MAAIAPFASLGAIFSPSLLPARNSLEAGDCCSAPSPQDERSAFDKEWQKLQAYLQEREAAYRAKHGNGEPTEDAVAVVFPNIPGLGSPFVTADQQRAIDEITDQYRGKKVSGGDIAGLYDKLWARGVHPSQLVQTAQFFTGVGGRIVDRNGVEIANVLSPQSAASFAPPLDPKTAVTAQLYNAPAREAKNSAPGVIVFPPEGAPQAVKDAWEATLKGDPSVDVPTLSGQFLPLTLPGAAPAPDFTAADFNWKKFVGDLLYSNDLARPDNTPEISNQIESWLTRFSNELAARGAYS